MNELTPGETEFEAALSRLAVARPGDLCAAISYEAGRRDGRKSMMGWRVCSGTLAAVLAISLVSRGGVAPQVKQERSSMQLVLEVSVGRVLERDSNAYLAVREAVLAHGLDALPATPGGMHGGEGPPVRAGDVEKYSEHDSSLFGERS